MKKIFLILLLIIIPIEVNADVDFERIHNELSESNELILNSIPITYYRESNNYKKCVSYEDTFFPEEHQKNFCLNDIYRLVVKSSLRDSLNLPDGVRFDVNSCDYATNICNIYIYNDEGGLNEEYNVTFSGEYNESLFEKANDFGKDIKKRYYLSDMSYINQLINYTNESGFFDAVIYDNSKILNIFPEFKNNLEKNPEFNYVPVTLGVGGSPILYGSSSVVVLYYDGVAVGISEDFSYYTMQLIYVPDTTENTKEAYIEVVKNRIEEYLNNDEYKIALEYDEDYEKEYCGDEFNVCDVSRDLNYIFEDEKMYMASPYKLKINGNEYFVGIVPVAEEDIRELEVKSIDYETDISIETNGSNVPLDTILRVKDKSKEYGKHGYDRVYDINLYSLLKDGYITKIYDGVRVRIPLSDNYKHNKVDIYHIKENGEKGEKYNAEVIEINGKKYAEFTTNHFSLYGFEGENNPQTYDNISINIILLLVGFFGTFITILKSREQ